MPGSCLLFTIPDPAQTLKEGPFAGCSSSPQKYYLHHLSGPTRPGGGGVILLSLEQQQMRIVYLPDNNISRAQSDQQDRKERN